MAVFFFCPTHCIRNSGWPVLSEIYIGSDSGGINAALRAVAAAPRLGKHLGQLEALQSRHLRGLTETAASILISNCGLPALDRALYPRDTAGWWDPARRTPQLRRCLRPIRSAAALCPIARAGRSGRVQALHAHRNIIPPSEGSAHINVSCP